MTTTALAPGAPRLRAAYSRLAATGFLLAALAPAILASAGLIVGLPSDDLGFLAVATAVPLAAAILVWRFGTWAKYVAIVAGVLTAATLFWTAFGLSYPGSFADFVPGVLLPLGVVLGIGGSVASLVQKRRGVVSQRATNAERWIIAVALGTVLLAAAVSGTLYATGRADPDAALGVPSFTMTMSNFEFTQAEYTIDAGPLRTIRVRNDDPFVHTVTIPALGVHEVVLPRTERVVQLRAPRGTYTIYCKPHADMNVHDPTQAGMAATLIAE